MQIVPLGEFLELLNKCRQILISFLIDKLNTMVDDTDTKRPDGHMSQFEERTIQFSTGFIEVKPSTSRTSSQKTHEDTIRLVNFCKDATEKKNMKSIIAVQAVGK